MANQPLTGIEQRLTRLVMGVTRMAFADELDLDDTTTEAEDAEMDAILELYNGSPLPDDDDLKASLALDLIDSVIAKLKPEVPDVFGATPDRYIQQENHPNG